MKKILPPILFLIFVVTMGATCWGIGSPHKLTHPFTLAGLPLILMGLGLSIVGKKLFQKMGTNVMTFEQPDVLVTQGVYRYSRNPMYLGFVVALFGSSLLMGASISSFLLVALFFIITDRWYIRFEELEMTKKFGTEYQAYSNNVRRWI